MTSNPFFHPSRLPYELPPFAQVDVRHFAEAFDHGMTAELAEVDAIAHDAEPPTFANTIVALERTGAILRRASRVFSLLVGSDTTPELQELQAEYAPRFAAHSDTITMNRALFERIAALYQRADDLGLDPESSRLLERYHTDCVRSGAGLDQPAQQRLAALNIELAELCTRFGNNLLADSNDSAVHVSDPADLDGLAPDAVDAARQAAADRGLDGYLLTLVLPTHQPALETLRRPEIRRRLLDAAQSRGARGNAYDNRALVGRIAALRAERAELLGYVSHSDYVLADRTARNNDALDAMLRRLIPPAVRNAGEEAAELAALKAAAGDPEPFAASDWAYYAQQVRRREAALDAGSLRPYFEVFRTLEEGVFYAAEQLYGITFHRRPDLVAHHREARVWEVFDADGSGLGLFIADVYTRDSKRGGAWMESLVTQSRLLDQRPVVVNTMNVPRPSADQPGLLTLYEVGTMFHEFGHALHGLLSDVTYPRLAGTAVARDFVEFPSQVNEMWLSWPAVLERYAHHIDDGSPLPAEQAEALRTTSTERGYETVSYLAATWIDLAWHRLSPAEARVQGERVAEFEAEALAAAGLNLPEVPPRYRGPYFNHVFAGSGYAGGYYSYIWSEVLDADTVDWFIENGGLRREPGERFRRALLSRGGSVPELDQFAAFRGRPPSIDALLRRRGLLDRGVGK